MNTVHTCDIASASWALAQWMSGLGRKEADKLAGEDIPPNDKNKVKEATDLPEADLASRLLNLSLGDQIPSGRLECFRTDPSLPIVMILETTIESDMVKERQTSRAAVTSPSCRG